MELVWTTLPQATPSAEFAKLVGGHPLVAQLLVQRGIRTPEAARSFLHTEHYTPAPPTNLIGVELAAQLLYEAIRTDQNILVWGDFDVDGQTSTSLLVSGLQALTKPGRVRFHVPNRFTESHGIRAAMLQKWLDDPTWQPQLLLSCDTGIAEAEAVTLAKAHGLTVVLTDHHDLTAEFSGLSPRVDPLWGLSLEGMRGEKGEEGQWNAEANEPSLTPPPFTPSSLSVRYADAIVNPKFQPEDDPLRTLPGVGVAYKLMQQLYALVGRSGDELELLDLVALGIVADVAEQVHDARYLLQLGLEQLKRTRRTGLLALMEVARVAPANISTDDIGFQIGPRMNALGRLEDATISVELLTTRDAVRAGQLAAKLERLNQQRRLLTSQITAAALEMVNRTPQLLDYNALVLTHPAWHAGIVGIVASRLVEEFSRPAVLLLNPPGEAARGSARSIPGVDIGASIAGCAHLLIGHGGHPGAAGLSLQPENIDAFRRELDRQIELHRTDDGPPSLSIDAELRLDEIDLNLVGEIQRLAPFGNGNPTPQFLSRGLRIVHDQRMGRDGAHRKFTVQQAADGPQWPVLWFNHNDGELPPEPIDLVYTLSINEYRGERTVQLMYVAARPAEQLTVEPLADKSSKPRIRDLRGQTVQLGELPTPRDAIWFAEGTQLGEAVTYVPRTEAQPHAALVLWTIPPSPVVLKSVLERVEPRRIFVCGQSTTNDRLDFVLQQTAAMCKYALAREGRLDISRMAARLGTTEGVIRHSLLWLECKELIRIAEWLEDDALRIEAPGPIDPSAPATAERRADRDILQAELDAQLAEVAAYRRYFQRAKLDELGIG